MKAYDSVVVLGSRPLDVYAWKFPSHVYKSLDKAIELYEKKATKYITVSGKWTINFDILGITQPFRECDAMADYLLDHGIPAKAILREGDSKDTISNLYYLKRQIFKPKSLKTLLFIAAEPRLNRIRFLNEKILGPRYKLDYEGVAYLPGEVSINEGSILKIQTEFLATMADGDDAWLDGKFYEDLFYKRAKDRARERAFFEPVERK